MSFKVHLIIVSCIIVAVLLVWQFMPAPITKPSENASINVPVAPTYSLAITHASWGLTCSGNSINSDDTRTSFLSKSNVKNALREDNILEAVSRLCNGKPNCDISTDESMLGTDPAPGCNNKIIEIEYRCFSYDRPWNVKSFAASVSLNCGQSAK